MNITRFSIKRPVGISMIVCLFVVLGLFSFIRIGVELLPAVNTPYITVMVRYPGASAESVEQQVVKLVAIASLYLLWLWQQRLLAQRVTSSRSIPIRRWQRAMVLICFI